MPEPRPSDFAEFVARAAGALRVPAPGSPPAALLAGSFNPPHWGHRELALAASSHLGVPVHFELSVANVEKPPLSADDIARRLALFDPAREVVWLTHAPTFAEKARLFPGAAFVVGFDTALRLIDPAFARNSVGECRRRLAEIGAAGGRFVVAGRVDRAGQFQTWPPASAPEWPELAIVEGLPAGFRADVSSTALRADSAPSRRAEGRQPPDARAVG